MIIHNATHTLHLCRACGSKHLNPPWQDECVSCGTYGACYGHGECVACYDASHAMACDGPYGNAISPCDTDIVTVHRLRSGDVACRYHEDAGTLEAWAERFASDLPPFVLG